jgi:magnesium chelatase family protein
MLAKVLSSALHGIDAIIVEVEVDIAQGLPQFATVGLPDGAVKESKDRVKSALKNSGYDFPNRKITVNLAPADIRKEGASFDLPVAVGILAATGVVKKDRLKDYLLLGELSLDGRIKPVRGCLSVAVAAKREGFSGIIVPRDNACEGGVVKGIEVFGVEELAEVVEFLNGDRAIVPHVVDIHELFRQDSDYVEDFSEVKGQEHAKRALEVAAAGGHNILMVCQTGPNISL